MPITFTYLLMNTA